MQSLNANPTKSDNNIEFQLKTGKQDDEFL